MPAERSRLLRIADLQRHAVVPDTGAAGDGQILPLGKADGLPVVEGDILLQYIAGQIQQELCRSPGAAWVSRTSISSLPRRKAVSVAAQALFPAVEAHPHQIQQGQLPVLHGLCRVEIELRLVHGAVGVDTQRSALAAGGAHQLHLEYGRLSDGFLPGQDGHQQLAPVAGSRFRCSGHR